MTGETAHVSDRPAASRRQRVLGWIAVGICIAISAWWAVWGILENFHEGWWKPTLAGRLVLTLAYLVPMLITMAMTLIAIRFPRFGATVFFVLGGLFTYFIFANRWPDVTLETVLSWLPLTAPVIAVGFIWWFGRVEPRRLGYLLAIVIPLILVVGFGAEPAWRVAHRVDDGDRSARLIQGNGVELIWAPAGPGWVRTAADSTDWYEATERCRYITEDGLALSAEPQDIWRLPTAEEAVASLTRRGENAGGVWDAQRGRATYRIQPDKESPLWDVYSEIIYLWTATETTEDKAYIYVYDGVIWKKSKLRGMGSQGFRAVKDVRVGDGMESGE